MHAIELDLAQEDFAAFNLHVMRTSDLGRRQRNSYRLSLALIGALVGGFVVGLLLGDLVQALAAAAVAGVGLWLLGSRAWLTEVTKNVRRMAERGELGTAGSHVLTLDDDGIREETGNSRTDIPWSGIQRVDETDDHAFIFFGPTQALVLPKRSAGVDAFLRQVEARIVRRTAVLTSGSS